MIPMVDNVFYNRPLVTQHMKFITKWLIGAPFHYGLEGFNNMLETFYTSVT